MMVAEIVQCIIGCKEVIKVRGWRVEGAFINLSMSSDAGQARPRFSQLKWMHGRHSATSHVR